MTIKSNSMMIYLYKKTLKLRNMRIVVKAVFHEDNKYCPQVFLDE